VKRAVAISGLTWLLSAALIAAEPAEPAVQGIEFFEKRIRPLLTENCHQCHGAKKQESGLALNSVAGIRNGGDRGPAIVTGEPDASVLIQAVRYTDDDLKMPPRGKLKNEQIADLVAWVKLGAPLPADDTPAIAAAKPSSEFNLAERRKHWAYQPVRIVDPPIAGSKLAPGESGDSAGSGAPGPGLVPAKSISWCADAIDAFVLSRLNAAGLSPSPPADKRALIRRVTFDLAGLPPMPAEVAAFLNDEAPDAYERLVDRLLASPRYGERFGRHWLDIMRYSETLGFEFDYDLHNAWRYRDYVIRAFNADLPYDQFVVEHLAGDLVEQPRRHPLDGTNESILATGFWWMHEGKQTPVDIRQDQADRIDNQLDVLGKAFFGQTIACARCHDHKFDAISTKDYYSLAGYLRSSRYQQAFIDPPESFRAIVDQLAATRAEIQQTTSKAIAAAWLKHASQTSGYLMAAAAVDGSEKDDAKLEVVAKEHRVDAQRLRVWMKALADDSVSAVDHPLASWARVAKHEVGAAATQATSESDGLASETPSGVRFANDFVDWFPTGPAFGGNVPAAGQIVLGGDAKRPITRLTSGGVDSGAISLRLQGEMRSPSFTIDKKFVHVRVAGRNARVNLVIDGYTLIMNPMYGKLTVAPASDRLVWRTIPVDRWVGHRAFLEASDSTIPMHGLNPPPSPAREPRGADGYVVLKEAVLSDDPLPPATQRLVAEAATEQSDGSPQSLAEGYQRQMIAAIERWRDAKWDSPQQREDDVGLINWLLESGHLDGDGGSAADDAVAQQLAKYRETEAGIPTPRRAPAIADGTGEDEFVFLRGNWRTPGDRAPRDVPEALRVSTERAESNGSGRWELARRLVHPSNPLSSRVIGNRLWQHHFGEGIVRTPDDFGRMGQPPSHPELLDYVAAELIRGGWSLKAATRRMVTTATYRQRSGASLNPEPRTLNPTLIDPDNRLLSHMPIRRLEAEAIRDSMLAVSGRLNEQMHGPSVLPHVTPYMEGRGKPQSGPLDGEGRRSLYINARRNFLTSLLLAFDYPVTFTPIGRRGTTAIPAQALTLMNDPFVVGQARQWAEQTLAESGSAERRIESLYQTAFARPPTADELSSAVDFLQEQSLRHGGGSDDVRVWTDLCHVLMNVKEFIFIE
jgi:mono/diheme cytochrome c family protein